MEYILCRFLGLYLCPHTIPAIALEDTIVVVLIRVCSLKLHKAIRAVVRYANDAILAHTLRLSFELLAKETCCDNTTIVTKGV